MKKIFENFFLCCYTFIEKICGGQRKGHKDIIKSIYENIENSKNFKYAMPIYIIVENICYKR